MKESEGKTKEKSQDKGHINKIMIRYQRKKA